MHAVLISTYELGRQPYGLASPAAWLRAQGIQVTCLDLAVAGMPEATIRAADLVALYLPMHTATRLAIELLPRIRALNPSAHLLAYGLYAPLNEALLRAQGVESILGGEFERDLARICAEVAGDPGPEVRPLGPPIPDRAGLPPLAAYAQLRTEGGDRVVGYTEATHGCKHLCRHCPVVPVYQGRFRAVPRDLVLADIRQQVASGARHITFGDPDFLNGPGHAVPIVTALHQEFPELTYDVTIKVEHLLRHASLLPTLRDTGCAFVTSAVESFDDAVLARFEKHHTRADIARAAELMRAHGLPLNPTFVTFTPWTSRESYRDLLQQILQLGLVDHVAPVQYAIRLLIPAGSRLLELPEVQGLVGAFDERALCYPWKHPDPGMDELFQQVRRVAQRSLPRRTIFAEVWRMAHERPAPEQIHLLADRPIPYLTEPWYC
jgi:radical SAM superfamily enzyme YgiQ (UPF0313 family)